MVLAGGDGWWWRPIVVVGEIERERERGVGDLGFGGKMKPNDTKCAPFLFFYFY
jgi:hypothetical protein